jgi:hypothetical protein
MASHNWPESNRRFQNDLAAIFSYQRHPFLYCHAFTAEGLGYTGSEESVSRRVTRDLWEAKRASALVGRKTFEYIPGRYLRRPTQYVTNYLNAAAEYLRDQVNADLEAIPFAAKVSKHLPEARKLLPRLEQKSIKRRLRKAGKRARKNTGGGASILKDDLNVLSELGLAAVEYANEGYFVVPLYSAVDGVCDCKEGAECQKPGKHPRIKKHIQCASCNPQVVAGWWRRWPNAGVGLATGRMVSPGVYLIVIDVDRRKFGHGSLAILADELGESLPETRTILTADGWHYYCLIRSDVPVSSFAYADRGIEIKASSGIVVAPPTVRSNHLYRAESETDPLLLSSCLAEWVLTRGRRAKVSINDRHKFLVRCGRALAGKKLSQEEILGTLRVRLLCCEAGGRVIDDTEVQKIAEWAFNIEAQQSQEAIRVA